MILLDRIVQYCYNRDLMNLSLVCKYFNTKIKESVEYLHSREFNKLKLTNNNIPTKIKKINKRYEKCYYINPLLYRLTISNCHIGNLKLNLNNVVKIVCKYNYIDFFETYSVTDMLLLKYIYKTEYLPLNTLNTNSFELIIHLRNPIFNDLKISYDIFNSKQSDIYKYLLYITTIFPKFNTNICSFSINHGIIYFLIIETNIKLNQILLIYKNTVLTYNHLIYKYKKNYIINLQSGISISKTYPLEIIFKFNKLNIRHGIRISTIKSKN